MSQKERIISEAAAMFADEGIKSVQMDDIAMRLRVSKPTLYEMFGDKRDLLVQSLKHHFNKKRIEMMVRTDEAENVMEEIFMIMGSMHRDERDAVLVSNLKKFYPDIYNSLEEEACRYSHGKLDDLFDRGIGEGLFLADMNKDLALTTLIYTMASLFERKPFPHSGNASSPPPVPPRTAFEYVLVNFFRGLATHKGIEVIDKLVEKYKEIRR